MGRKINVYAIKGKKQLTFESTVKASKYFKCSQSHICKLINEGKKINGYELLTDELLEHYEEKPPKEDGVLVKDLLDEKGYDIVHYTKPNCFVWYGFFTTKNTNPLDIRLYKKVLLLYENNTENGIRRVIAI